MKTPYRFIKRTDRPYYQVQFAHIPGRWFSTKATTMAEAVKFAEAKMDPSHSTSKKETTLRKFAEGFFGAEDPHGYRHRLERRNTFYDNSYYEAHAARLKNYILPAHGAYLLTAIKDTMIEDFILDLPKLADSTKNKILACYRIVLNEAVREGYIEKNPAKEVMELNENNKSREVFTEEEYHKMFPEDDEELIRIWGNLKWAVYFCVQKDTGWRPGEVAGLSKLNYFPELKGVYTQDDVDFRTHELKHRIKTTRKGQKFKEGFLSDQTDRILQQLIAVTNDNYLFHLQQTRDKFIYPERANEQLRIACAKVGIDLHGRTQYSFRHSWNTNALGSIPEVARLLLMGHTSNRQEYNHLTPKQALERVLSIEGVREALTQN